MASLCELLAWKIQDVYGLYKIKKRLKQVENKCLRSRSKEVLLSVGILMQAGGWLIQGLAFDGHFSHGYLKESLFGVFHKCNPKLLADIPFWSQVTWKNLPRHCLPHLPLKICMFEDLPIWGLSGACAFACFGFQLVWMGMNLFFCIFLFYTNLYNGYLYFGYYSIILASYWAGILMIYGFYTSIILHVWLRPGHSVKNAAGQIVSPLRTILVGQYFVDTSSCCRWGMAPAVYRRSEPMSDAMTAAMLNPYHTVSDMVPWSKEGSSGDLWSENKSAILRHQSLLGHSRTY